MSDNTDREELLPCPFCGVVPAMQSHTQEDEMDEGRYVFFVECANNKCPMGLVSTGGPFREASNAAKQWNSRAAVAAPPDEKLVKRLVDAVYRSMAQYDDETWWLDELKAKARVRKLLTPVSVASVLPSRGTVEQLDGSVATFWPPTTSSPVAPSLIPGQERENHIKRLVAEISVNAEEVKAIKARAFHSPQFNADTYMFDVRRLLRVHETCCAELHDALALVRTLERQLHFETLATKGAIDYTLELEQKLEAAATPATATAAPTDLDVRLDRAYIAGMQFGRNAGEAEYQAAIRGRFADIHAAASSSPGTAAATSGAREAATEILDYLNFDCSLPSVQDDVEAAASIIQRHTTVQPWCDSCQSPHASPRNPAHQSELGCRGTWYFADAGRALSEKAREVAEEICAYFGDPELAMGGHVSANGIAAIISKHFPSAVPVEEQKLTNLQHAVVEHDDDMARLDRNTLQENKNEHD